MPLVPPIPPALPVEGPLAGSVRLRLHRPEDVDDVWLMCQDAAAQAWTTIPVPYEHRHAVEFCSTRQSVWATGTYFTLAVEWEGRVSGALSLRPDGAGAAEVGFLIAPWARGRGVGGAAVRALLHWAFATLDLAVVQWRAGVGNWPSRRLAWSCGFHVDARVPALLDRRGVRQDAWLGWLRRGDAMRPAHPWLETPTLAGTTRAGAGVVLRPPAETDAEWVREACADAVNQYWLPLLPSPYTLDDARAFLVGCGEDAALARAVHWAVTAPKSGDRGPGDRGPGDGGPDGGEPGLLGFVTLRCSLADGTGEVGYWTHPDGRRRGVTTAATRLAARHAVIAAEDGGLGLRRVLLRAAEGNTGSQRVAIGAGFRHVGTDRLAERLRDGTELDMLRFDLLATEV